MTPPVWSGVTLIFTSSESSRRLALGVLFCFLVGGIHFVHFIAIIMYNNNKDEGLYSEFCLGVVGCWM